MAASDSGLCIFFCSFYPLPTLDKGAFDLLILEDEGRNADGEGGGCVDIFDLDLIPR